jgi:PAS domain S-box-containing protein
MKSIRPLRRLLAMHFALAASVPLAAVAVLVWLSLLPQMRTEIGIRHQALARSIAGQVTTYLLGAERELRALAEYIGIQDKKPAPFWFELLDSNAGTGDVFEAIYIADQDDLVFTVGLSQARRESREDILGLDLSRRAFIHKARVSKEGVWSETFLSTVSARLAVAWAFPLYDDQVVIGEITIDRLSEFISHLPGKSGLFTMILDRRDRIIADSQDTSGGQQSNLNYLPILHDALVGHPVTRDFELEGKQFIGTAVGVKELGWTVLVAQPHGEAFQQITSTLWVVAAGLVFALLLAVGAGWLLSRDFSLKFGRYTQQARAIANGDYDQPWPESNTLEFADLVGNLKRMSQAIRERERELAASEARYRSVVSNAPVVILQFSDQGVITLKEGKGLERIGLAADESTGQSIFDIYCDFPDICLNARLAIGGEPTQFATQIGDNVLDIYFNPVQEGNDFLYVLGVVVDITEKKQAEEELARHRDHLEELVKERTLELEAAQKELVRRERFSVLGQVTATVSHELRNPLAVIRSSTFFLQRKLLEADGRVAKHLARIDKQVNICNGIVEDLLEYTRESHSRKVNGEINSYLQSLLTDFAEVSEVKISYCFAPEVPPLFFDREKMRRVFVNLLTNAVQAVDSKKELSKRDNYSFQPDIRVSTEMEDGGLVIQIEDNGMGMDWETVNRAFEPLFTTRARGTGLGLSIVKKIITDHGGAVVLESIPDEGTVVKISLPIAG